MTPGPWQSHSDAEPLTIIGAIDGPDDGRMNYTIVCEVENEGDVPLISCAPDLADGLADAVGLIRGCAGIFKDSHPLTSAMLDNKAAALLALLVKATRKADPVHSTIESLRSTQ